MLSRRNKRRIRPPSWPLIPVFSSASVVSLFSPLSSPMAVTLIPDLPSQSDPASIPALGPIWKSNHFLDLCASPSHATCLWSSRPGLSLVPFPRHPAVRIQSPGAGIPEPMAKCLTTSKPLEKGFVLPKGPHSKQSEPPLRLLDDMIWRYAERKRWIHWTKVQYSRPWMDALMDVGHHDDTIFGTFIVLSVCSFVLILIFSTTLAFYPSLPPARSSRSPGLSSAWTSFLLPAPSTGAGHPHLVLVIRRALPQPMYDILSAFLGTRIERRDDEWEESGAQGLISPRVDSATNTIRKG